MHILQLIFENALIKYMYVKLNYTMVFYLKGFCNLIVTVSLIEYDFSFSKKNQKNQLSDAKQALSWQI